MRGSSGAEEAEQALPRHRADQPATGSSDQWRWSAVSEQRHLFCPAPSPHSASCTFSSCIHVTRYHLLVFRLFIKEPRISTNLYLVLFYITLILLAKQVRIYTAKGSFFHLQQVDSNKMQNYCSLKLCPKLLYMYFLIFLYLDNVLGLG